MPEDLIRSYNLSEGSQVINIEAGETVELVSTSWPGIDNEHWSPDLILQVSGNYPGLIFIWENTDGTTSTRNVESGYHTEINIPDTPNKSDHYHIQVTAMSAGNFTVAIGNK